MNFKQTANPLILKRAVVALCIGVACLSASACARKSAAPQMGGFAMPVSAAPIKRGDIATYFTVTGSVVPAQSASLSSVISGTVKTVTAQIGQRVHAGDLLVQIDDSTLSAQQSQAAANLAQVEANSRGGNISAQANLNSARIAYETAQANLRRNEQLLQQGYVSKAAIDQARQQAASADAAYRAAQATAQNASLGTGRDSAATAALRSAEAALRTVNSEIAQASVRAPFDGVVAVRNVDPGSLASPGSVLMEVAQLDPLFVDVGIAGDQLGHVHVGTPVTVAVSSFGTRTWHGNIGYLDLAAVPGTSIYQARIPLANPDLALRGGMVATVSFQQSRKANVLLVPRTAVFQTDAGYSMFVIDGGKAKAVPVEVGLSNDQETEVSGAGLKPGIQAILNHSPLLQPGTPVQVMPAQTSAHS